MSSTRSFGPGFLLTVLLTLASPAFGQASQAGEPPAAAGQAGEASTPTAKAGGASTASGKLGMVVSAEKNATEAGAEVLRNGGNAVDAAVAVAYALAVTHPDAGNLGGGGFMVVAMADGRTAAIDYRETAPSHATHDMYLDEHGAMMPDASTLGGKAAGIPGTVAGLELARQRFGTRPHRELVQAALRLARDGHRLDEVHAGEMAKALDEMKPFPDSLAIYSNAGKPWKAGDLWVQKDLAGTLRNPCRPGAPGVLSGRPGAAPGRGRAQGRRHVDRAGPGGLQDGRAPSAALRDPRLHGPFHAAALLGGHRAGADAVGLGDAGPGQAGARLAG